MNKKILLVLIIILSVALLGTGGFFAYKYFSGGSKNNSNTDYGKMIDKYYESWKNYDEKGMLECFHPNFGIVITSHDEEEKYLETGYWFTYGDSVEIEDVLEKDPTYASRAYLGEVVQNIRQKYNVNVTDYKVLNLTITYVGQGDPKRKADEGRITAKEVLVLKIDGNWYLTEQPEFWF